MKLLLKVFFGLFVIQLTPMLIAQSITTIVGGGSNPVTGGIATDTAFEFVNAVLPDGSGGFYFASGGQTYNSVYHVRSDGKLTIIAGVGLPGFSGDGGPAIAAQLWNPRGLALDLSGNLYISDTVNHRIRKVTPAGIITTVVGTGLGESGDNGPASAAQLNNPAGILLDSVGNLYIADSGSNRIRRVGPDGVIRTVAGSLSSSSIGGFSGDGGPASQARLSRPVDIALDNAGNLYIADSNNSRVRKVGLDGVITTLLTLAQFNTPEGVAIDSQGNLLVAAESRIRRVTPDGITSIIAGAAVSGFSGDGGQASQATFNGLWGIRVDAGNNVLVADRYNFRIRRIAASGIVTTVAGKGRSGFAGDNGPAISAMLNTPLGITLDSAGNILIADSMNNRVRKVNANGVITAIAGDGTLGISGDGGLATAAALFRPTSVAMDPAGNIFITDCSNRIRKVTPDGLISTFTNTNWGFCTGTFYYYLYFESDSGGGLATDSSGNLYVADTFRHRIFRVTPSGVVTVFAGTGVQGSAGDNGPAIVAQLNQPRGIAVDAARNIYVADTGNFRVRRISSTGVITTVAGTGVPGFSGDGGPAIAAQMNPTGIALGPSNTFFIADAINARIRRITSAGNIETVAGNGQVGFFGDNGPAIAASLSLPIGVALDSVGNLLIADTANHRIRRVRFVLGPPTLTTVAPDIVAPGTTVNMAVAGTNFANPLTVSPGAGITLGTLSVQSDNFAAATFNVDSNATLGARNLTVTTDLGTSNAITFNVVPPFPDLSISSSHSNLGVGFEGTYTITIRNAGVAPTSGPITITDVLPQGFSFVSASPGWTCSATGQTLVCSNPVTLASGETTALTLKVAVGSGAAATVVHNPTVTVNGDPIATNNSTADMTAVATPAVAIQLDPVAAGVQSSIGVSVPIPFPQEVTGTLRMSFAPNAVNSADDPAIQFSTGGREVTFSIPANQQHAQFPGISTPRIGFQSGTVAGTFTFEGTLRTGDIQSPFSVTRTIFRQPPEIRSTTRDSAGISLHILSTTRDMTTLTLQFVTAPAARLSCGNESGCTVAGDTLLLNVKSLFDNWFVSQTTYGGLSTLRIPLTLQGGVRGTINVRLQNAQGLSVVRSIAIP